MAPSAFISYSWDSDAHKEWVRALAERLRADGVEATLDQWEAIPGDQLPAFMERSIAGNAYVLIICTPRYKVRSEKRAGGVGYEGDIITGELLQHGNQRKFIPLLRLGEWTEAAPGWLAGKYHVDLRESPRYEQQYQDLLTTLLGTRPVPPPVAPPRPLPSREAALPVSTTDSVTAPPRILGVIADQVGTPSNDGTRGSALYVVPFRLSRSVSSDWARVFENVWNRPPRFTSMHRPGIARVRGDRIILDGTTLDEVQKYHRDTLVLCVEATNRIVAEYEAKQRAEAEERGRREEEHKRHVRDAADRIRFD